MGAIPTTAQGLAVLSQAATNSQNQTAGPFLNVIPAPPGGGNPAWLGSCVYRSDTAPGGGAAPGRFVICTTGDGFVAHNETTLLDLPLTFARVARAVPGPSSDLPEPGKMFSRIVRLRPPG